MMNKIGLDHMVCFKRSDNGHYYIGFTVHSLIDFICHWMGDVSDCYNLFSRSLYEPFNSLQSLSPLDVIYESYEELD